MSEIKVEIHGLAELEQKLRDESKNVARKVLRVAVRKAGEIWQAEIESRAPRATGRLSTHIEMATKSTSGLDGQLKVLVGPGKNVFYGLFQEFGTRHQEAKPFMRPAFQATKDQVLDTFVQELRQGLNDLAKK